LSAHWLCGDVLLSNITFLIFAVLRGKGCPIVQKIVIEILIEIIIEIVTEICWRGSTVQKIVIENINIH